MRWKVLRSVNIFKSGFFRLRKDECELPDGRVMPGYYVMEFVDWVNVLPVTEDGQIALVEQYRHGAEDVFLEIPGGSTDPSPTPEDPRHAGERELREETGFEAKEWIYCGHHYPNPALQNNRMHTFLALGCRKVAEPELDPFEDLRTKLFAPEELIRMWQSGEIKHSLIAASLGIALPHLRARGIVK